MALSLPMDWGPLMIIFACVLVILLVITAKQHRRHAALTDKKQCRRCGGTFAATARFCGRCGNAL